jgi:transcriptional regulator with XRE-family HTH domain
MVVAGNGEWRRRAELTGLLQACRSRMVRPVPKGSSAGLRQEDAADLAGLSVRRYAAFERGEIANPLPEMVESVASVLHMTAAERSALHILATGHGPVEPPLPPDGARSEVSPVFLELLARQNPNPAVITDESWTIIAWNEAMSAWAGRWFDQAPAGQPNLVLYLFSDDSEVLLPDVHATRRAVIAMLRYQYARNVASDRFAAVVARVQASCPEARELWSRHEIAIPPRDYQVRVRHPGHGVIEAHDAALQISAWFWMHVVVFPDGVGPPGVDGR